MTLLADLGIPVEAGRGRHGGYRLRPGYKLPPLMFSEDEALALVLGLLAVRQHTLVGLGCPLIVLQPPELRDELRVLSRHAAWLAERTGE